MENNLIVSENLNLPYSLDAEQAVLGSLLKDPECLPLVSDMLKIDHLYLPQHKAIYTAILNIDTLGGRIDPLVVLEELKKEGVYDDIGGKTYLMKIADAVPSTKNVESYIKIIIDKYYIRTLMITAREILDETNNGTDSPDSLLDMAEQKIYDIRRGKNTTGPAKISDVIMSDVFERLKKLGSADPKEKEQYMGIPTGFSYLDRVLGGGFHRSDLILIGARPGMGKTSFALNVARNMAMRGRKTLFFSLEMSNEQLAQRIISTEARIVSNKLRTGEITDSDWEKLGLALQNLVNCELYFDDTSTITVPEMTYIHNPDFSYRDISKVCMSSNSPVWETWDWGLRNNMRFHASPGVIRQNFDGLKKRAIIAKMGGHCFSPLLVYNPKNKTI